MDQPNGVCWTITKESSIIMDRIAYNELFLHHDPSEDINTEVDFFEG